MKKILLTAFSAVALLLGSNLAIAANNDNAANQAATANVSAGLKVGIVDVRQVLQKSPQVAAAQKQLKSQFQTSDKQFKALQQQLQADMDKFNRDRAVMKDTDRKALQQKIQDEQQKLQGLQQNILTAQRQQMQTIMAKLQNAVNQVAQEGQFDLIFTKDNVAYAGSQLDITNQVLQAMTKQK